MITFKDFVSNLSEVDTREALMANISQQIQSTSDVEDALQVAVRELGRALGSDTSVKLKKSGNDRK